MLFRINVEALESHNRVHKNDRVALIFLPLGSVGVKGGVRRESPLLVTPHLDHTVTTLCNSVKRAGFDGNVSIFQAIQKKQKGFFLSLPQK